MNANAKRSTNTRIKRYRKWATQRGQPPSITSVLPAHLDIILQQFYAELSTTDGHEYEPESLRVMQTALDRQLKDQGYTHSILRDKEFDMGKLMNYTSKGKERGQEKQTA